jgi:hypothetical protein
MNMERDKNLWISHLSLVIFSHRTDEMVPDDFTWRWEANCPCWVNDVGNVKGGNGTNLLRGFWYVNLIIHWFWGLMMGLIIHWFYPIDFVNLTPLIIHLIIQNARGSMINGVCQVSAPCYHGLDQKQGTPGTPSFPMVQWSVFHIFIVKIASGILHGREKSIKIHYTWRFLGKMIERIGGFSS